MVMRIMEDRLKALCAQRGLSISALLARAGVSRNAFYSLLRKQNVLPASITRIADSLGVPAVAFMQAEPTVVEKARRLYREIERIKHKHEEVDPDNVRHTLLLLDERPVDRLRRALTRGQRFDFQ